MPPVVDLIALSLLPPSSWRHAAAVLRAGDGLASCSTRLLGGAPIARRLIDRRCARARPRIERAQTRGTRRARVDRPRRIRRALAAIADPPLVLWLRGRCAALAGRPSPSSARARRPPYGSPLPPGSPPTCRARHRRRQRPGARRRRGGARGALAARQRATIAVLGSGAD